MFSNFQIIVQKGEGVIMKLRVVTVVAFVLMFVLPFILTQARSDTSFGANLPPTASFMFAPEIPTPGEAVTFNASASHDSDGYIVQYHWDFGDGGVMVTTNPIASHSYQIDGNYTVELTVTDNGGLTGVSCAIIPVNCVEFFRVVYLGTLTPVPNVEVTAYCFNGSAWVKAPANNYGIEIKYDRVTQPKLSSTNAERFRNPGYTASILRDSASNIGWDIHQPNWPVYFKFTLLSSIIATWPNTTTRVYSYKNGAVESHDYSTDHRAYWDPLASAYVIRAGNIAENGVSPSSSHPIIVGMYCPPPQKKYYLTVRTDPASITTIPGEGWYVNGTDATLTAPTYVNVSSNTRYRFSYWDVDGTSKGSGVNPITVRMNANHTATAHYVTQYSVIFSQTGLQSDASGTVVTVNTNTKAYADLPFTLWVDSGSSVTYSYSSPVASTVSGKRYRLNTVTGPTSPISVTAPKTVAGNYVIQYSVTITQTGMDSTATGTVVTVNSDAKTYADLPFVLWVDSGSSVTYSFASPVSSSASGKRFRLNSVTGPTSPITVTTSTTVTGNFVVQYLVTFGQSGLDSTATGTVVTVNGNAKTFGDLPFTLWLDTGSSVTYSYSSTVSSSVTNKRFRLGSVTGPTSPMTVTGSVTVTGNYVVQYLVTFCQAGLDSTATGTVVTVDGAAKSYSDLPFSKWVDSGASVTYSYSSTVSSTTTGKRFRLDTVTGPASPITVSGAVSVTGNFVVQYLVTFGQSGLDSTATGTVVTVNGNAKTYADLPFTLWVDTGSSVTYSFASPVSSSTSGKRFRLNSVTGPTSPITVAGATTVTGNYVVQYLITFSQSGLDSTATGTVVTVNGNAKLATDLPFDLWVDSGSAVTYSYNDIVLSTTSGKRFKLVSVTGPASPVTVTGKTTVTGNYKTQYQVTFDQSGVGSDFTGTVVTVDSVGYGVSSLPISFWWDKDSSHNFSFGSPLVVDANKQYSWSSTSGMSTLQSGTLTITGSGSVTGNYIVANCVTFDHVGVGADFIGTIVVVDSTSYTFVGLPVSFTWTMGSVHNFAFQSPLVVTPNAKRYVWTSTTGLSTSQSGSITVTSYGCVIGHYKTQYYLNVPSNPPGKANPSGSGWYDAGSYASISTDLYVPGGSRYRFAGWTTADMSEITDPMSPNTTVLIDKPKNVTANYIHQYLVTFDQTGLTPDATGAVLTVNSTTKAFTDLPYGVWVDENGILNYSYGTTVTSSTSGKRFRLNSVTGLTSPITVTDDFNVTGNYVAQYYLTVSTPYGTPGGQGWYDYNTIAYATLDTGVVDHGNATRHVFTNWNGDATGTNYAQSNAITMNGPKTAIARWKTQYSVTFTQNGLDSSASSTVVIVNGSPKTYGQLPFVLWVDAGGSATYAYSNVSSSTTGKRFTLTSVTGLASPIVVTTPETVTGNYIIQYQITFNHSGVGPDFTGAIVNVDGTGYAFSALPKVFWLDSGSFHTFTFYSPLVVNMSKQYQWISTSGLSTLQSGTLTITVSGSVTGNYAAETKYKITFAQVGVGSGCTWTVLIVDGVNYRVVDLSISFWWDSGTSHTFAYQSPLFAPTNTTQYVWTSTSGLSTSQSGTIVATTSGSVTGNYKTQYCLMMATNPSGITIPTGAGFYDANSYATISTDAFVDIVPGASRYRFNGWSTTDMSEIANPNVSPTTVLMDKPKTVTAMYVIQYKVTVTQSGVNADFTGTITLIDDNPYSFTGLPAPFWWDKDSSHSFAFQSPLTVTVGVKQYVWTSTTGLSTSQGEFITVSASGTITGHYKTQYHLTVTSPYGSPTPVTGWFDASASITVSVTSPSSGPTGTRYVCTGWTGTGSVPASGSATTVTFTIAQGSTVTWNWKTQHYLTVTTNPLGIATIPGEGWYDAPTPVTLTAPSVTGYNFLYWFLDGSSQGAGINPITVTLNAPHLATAHYKSTSTFTVTIQPMDVTITVGQSVLFTSTISGGTPNYTYQWYVGGSPASGANANTYVFLPTWPGTYYVYLKVTDANSNVAQSETARVVVLASPVGGYSTSFARDILASHILAYSALVILFGAALSFIKRKRE